MAYIEQGDLWDSIYQSEEQADQRHLVFYKGAIRLYLEDVLRHAGNSDIPKNKSRKFEKLIALLYEIQMILLKNQSDGYEYDEYEYGYGYDGYESDGDELEKKIKSLESSKGNQKLIKDIFNNEDVSCRSLAEDFFNRQSELYNEKARSKEHYIRLSNQAPYKLHVNFPLEAQLDSSYLAAKEIKEILMSAATEKIINSAKSFSGLLDGELTVSLENNERFKNHAQVTIYLPANPNFSKVFGLIEDINQIMGKYQIESNDAGVGDSLLAGCVSLRRDYDDKGDYKSADSADEKDLERNRETPLYQAFREKAQLILKIKNLISKDCTERSKNELSCTFGERRKITDYLINHCNDVDMLRDAIRFKKDKSPANLLAYVIKGVGFTHSLFKGEKETATFKIWNKITTLETDLSIKGRPSAPELAP